MDIDRFINKMLNSNSYIISNNNDKDVWVVDPGDSEPILEWITDNDKCLKGILITHYHFDHIYGINDLRGVFPEANVYSSEETFSGLCSSKKNMSYYNETPFEIKNKNVKIIKNEDEIILWNGCICTAYETLGHNNDCFSYFINDCLFTGDAFIPGVKLYFGARKANKDKAYRTIEWIFDFFDSNVVIYPGHNDCSSLKDAKVLK